MPEPLPETQEVLYPVLETRLFYARGTPGERVYVMPSGCFHGLTDPTLNPHELAGMGLAIVGNLVQLVRQDVLSGAVEPELVILAAPGAPAQVCPWPGMPDDRPLPLDLEALPWDSSMFLRTDDELETRKRLLRWQLMRRIEDVWVPWLQGWLQRFAAQAWEARVHAG